MEKPLFATQRKKILGLYEEAGQPFEASTLPYHSTLPLVFRVADARAADDTALLIADRGQTLDFFSYGIGDRLDWVAPDLRAGESETNLGKGKSTNGAADFIIEGIGLSCRGFRIDLDGDPSDIADPVGLRAVNGQAHIFDPAALLVPPQVQSPFNNENGLFQSILPLMSLEFEWDRSRTEKVGIADLLPQGGAASYMRANGVPASENRYRIPEGYLWRRDGEPDSEFIARMTLRRDVVIPIDLPAITPAFDADTQHLPNEISMEIVMRLFGLEVNLPSAN